VWSSLLAADLLLEQNRRRALIAAPLSVVLIVLMLRVVFDRLLHRPLRDLELAMKRAEAGDLRAEATVARKDELGLIAGRYNSMLSRIRNIIEERDALNLRTKRFSEELESKVAESTRELEEKNRELRRLNEDLYYTQRRLARMERLSAAQHIAARFAHKIGTPLNLISGHIQVLLHARKEGESLTEKLQLIQSQIEKLETIVRDMLDETRKPVLQLETVELTQLLERICALVEPTFAGRGIRVEKKLLADALTILGDETQLEQVFLNLLNNSLDAMQEGGIITVQMEKSGDGIRVEIGDTGEGMTESALSQMFRPFFTTKEIGRGTGLGLSVVKEILSAHGATISAESELGRGTWFTLVFPVTGTNNAEVSQDDSASDS
jgi:signal transduction histidine kinase